MERIKATSRNDAISIGLEALAKYNFVAEEDLECLSFNNELTTMKGDPLLARPRNGNHEVIDKFIDVCRNSGSLGYYCNMYKALADELRKCDSSLFTLVMKWEEDASLAWNASSAPLEHDPFLVFGRICYAERHIMWQAVPCGKDRRVYLGLSTVQCSLGPDITLVKLAKGKVERKNNKIYWLSRDFDVPLDVTSVVDSIMDSWSCKQLLATKHRVSISADKFVKNETYKYHTS